jgi:queuine tRNA-ribosyltransferase
LRHLDRCGEILAARLGTIHNLYFYISLMKSIREAIDQSRFDEFCREFYARRTVGVAESAAEPVGGED